MAFAEAALLGLLLGASPVHAKPGDYTARALKVLSENRFEERPWQPGRAAEISSRYGLEAWRVVAANYTNVSEEVFHLAGGIKNPHALEALEGLAERYAVLQAWQVRWAAEVDTPRELAAYRAVIAKKHIEQDEAEAALLDGLGADSSSDETRWSLRRSRLFAKVLDEALDGLPGSCRMRLSGAEVRVHDLAGLDVPVDKFAVWRAPVPAPDDGTCGGRPGLMAVYMAPFLATHAEEDAAGLRAGLMRELGCRVHAPDAPAPARRRPPPPSLVARAEDLRDALTSSPRPRKSPRSCALRRYEKPRVVRMDVVESARKVTRTVKDGDPLDRVADPAAKPVGDDSAAKHP